MRARWVHGASIRNYGPEGRARAGGGGSMDAAQGRCRTDISASEYRTSRSWARPCAPARGARVRAPGGGGAKLRVAIVAPAPDVGETGPYLVVGGAGPQHRPQVMARSGEQAGIQPPFGREPGPCAPAAERLAHRCDDPDLAPPVAGSAIVSRLLPDSSPPPARAGRSRRSARRSPARGPRRRAPIRSNWPTSMYSM